MVRGTASLWSDRLRRVFLTWGDAVSALLERGEWGKSPQSFGPCELPQDVPSDKLSSEEVRSSSCALTASIGNNRAKAISENEPNYEPDCESDCEVRHHIT
jgi:hypothetical protein